MQTFLTNPVQRSILNSPDMIKKIIERLSKRIKDKLAEKSCDAEMQLPSFDYLLKFVEKQLNLHSVASFNANRKS